MSRVEVIGDCTLYLGDCLEIMPLLGDNSIDMIWTDPPYGHNNHDGDWNARLSARAAMKGRKPFTGAIYVTIEAVFDPPKSWPKWKREAAYNGDLRHVVKPDVDNLAKQIDAFNGVLWVDDAQIDGLTIYKTYATDPRTIVKVQDTWESMTEAT